MRWGRCCRSLEDVYRSNGSPDCFDNRRTDRGCVHVGVIHEEGEYELVHAY